MRSKLWITFSAAMFVMGSSIPLLAHHAFGGEFDPNRPIPQAMQPWGQTTSWTPQYTNTPMAPGGDFFDELKGLPPTLPTGANPIPTQPTTTPGLKSP